MTVFIQLMPDKKMSGFLFFIEDIRKRQKIREKTKKYNAV